MSEDKSNEIGRIKSETQATIKTVRESNAREKEALTESLKGFEGKFYHQKKELENFSKDIKDLIMKLESFNDSLQNAHVEKLGELSPDMTPLERVKKSTEIVDCLLPVLKESLSAAEAARWDEDVQTNPQMTHLNRIAFTLLKDKATLCKEVNLFLAKDIELQELRQDEEEIMHRKSKGRSMFRKKSSKKLDKKGNG